MEATSLLWFTSIWIKAFVVNVRNQNYSFQMLKHIKKGYSLEVMWDDLTILKTTTDYLSAEKIKISLPVAYPAFKGSGYTQALKCTNSSVCSPTFSFF